MRELSEFKEAVDLLSIYPESIAWSDFGDRGNACTGSFKLKDKEEIVEDALALAAVKICMPKGSMLHRKMARSVAKILNCRWVTYDWLIKVVARIVACGSYQDFKRMLSLSVAIKSGMKQRG